MRLTIVRHGETVWNREKRFQGWADSPLTDEGRAQAAAAAAKLQGRVFDAYVTSSLGRARETAAILGDALGATFVPMEEFREIHCGDIAGRTAAEFLVDHPEFDDGTGGLVPREARVIPGGEPDGAAVERLRAGIRSLYDVHPEGAVLLVSHAGSLRRIRLILEDIPLHDPFDTVLNGGITEFEVRSDSL